MNSFDVWGFGKYLILYSKYQSFIVTMQFSCMGTKKNVSKKNP